MPYATREDLEARFSADEIQRLDDTRSGRVMTALADTHAELDGKLASTFALPLAGDEHPQLRLIACDIARARLYGRELPDVVRDRARQARKTLKGLVDGSVTLFDEQGVEIPVRQVRDSTCPDAPVMTATNLEGV